MSLKKRSLGAILGVFVSRLSGVIRTVIVNASFGVGSSLDAFNAAFRFPNSLRDLFADGALSAAFIKVYMDEKEHGKKKEQELISVTCGFFLVITTLLAVLAFLFSKQILILVSNDRFIQSGALELASNVFKALAFYLPLTMLNALAMAVLGVYGKTFRAMNASIFLSVGMIVGALVFAPMAPKFHFNPIAGLAAGALLGAFLQLIYQFKPLYDLKLLTPPSFSVAKWFAYKPLREILVLMFPRAIGQGALTFALLINTFFAISVGEGILTYIVTAVLIIQVPIGLFGVATGFAAQPVLTEALKAKDTQKFSETLTKSLESTMLLALFTTLCFALLIVPFYKLIFEHGKVTFNDTIGNALTVCAYSIGITFSAGSKILLSGFYSLNKTKFIIFNAIIYLITSATLSYLLAPRLGLLGLGLSYGTSTALDFFFNLFFLKISFATLSSRKLSPRSKTTNPYFASQFFGLKIFLFTVFSYGFALMGYFFTETFWKNHGEAHSFGTGGSPSFMLTTENALLFLIVGGALLSCLALGVTYLIAPHIFLKLKNFRKK